MALVNVKIKINNDVTKAVRISIDAPITDLLKDIADKLGNQTADRDHGIFQPAEKNKPPRFLKNSRTLKSYNIGNGAELLYKKKHRILKVQLLDDTIKAILIDSSKTVRKIIDTVGDKLNLKNSEEFSLKRLGGDGLQSDNLLWLAEDKTLHEQDIGEDEMLIFAKKYFSTDSGVDLSDPIQLHLIYIQAVKYTVTGRYDPLQRQEVVELAAIQAHVVHGNHDPTKHVPGFLQLENFMPKSFVKDRKIEADIFKEHKKLVGQPELTAKYRYVQLVRSLKTYGITFFLVDEKIKLRKKPQQILLGITQEKIIILDPKTRTIMTDSKGQPRNWELTMMKRWTSTGNTFTLDMGDFAEDYIICVTPEADAISQLIGGYIDIIVKAKSAEARAQAEKDSSSEANIEQMSLQTGSAMMSYTTGMTGGFEGYSGMHSVGPLQYISPQLSRGTTGSAMNIQSVRGTAGRATTNLTFPQAQMINVIDLTSAANATKALALDLDTGLEGFSGGGALTAEDWSKQMGSEMDKMNADIAKLLALGRMDPMDKVIMDTTAKSLTSHLMGMAIAAKNLSYLDKNQRDSPLMYGAKNLAEAVSRLLSGSRQLQASPKDPRLTYEMLDAEKALKVAVEAMHKARQAGYADRGAEMLILEFVKEAQASIEDIVESSGVVANSQVADATKKGNLINKIEDTKTTKTWILGTINQMAAVAIDPNIKIHMNQFATTMIDVAGALVHETKSAGASDAIAYRLDVANKRVIDALKNLLSTADIAEPRGAEGSVEMETPANNLQAALNLIRKNLDNPTMLVAPVKTSITAVNQLIRASKSLAETGDKDTRDRLLNTARNLSNNMQHLLDCARNYYKNPSDIKTRDEIADVAAKLEVYSHDVIADAGTTAAIIGLRYHAKATTAKMVQLSSTIAASFDDITDETTRNTLWMLGATLGEQINRMVGALKDASANPANFNAQKELQAVAVQLIPPFTKYVGETTKANKFISNNARQLAASQHGKEASDALKKLEKACKTVADISGITEIEEAMEDFNAINVELDAAEFAASQGLLQATPGQTREHAQELLIAAVKALIVSLDQLAKAAQSGKGLPTAAKQSADSVTQVARAVRAMASTIADRPTQKRLIQSAKEVTQGTINLIGSGKLLLVDREDPHKQQAVKDDHAKVKSSLATLLAAAKGLDARECDEAINNIKDLINKLTSKLPTNTPFKQASEHLASVAKALSAATSQLVAMARSNPRGVGAAAKITSVTMSQIVGAINTAASSANDDSLSEDILAAAKEMALAMAELLNAAKLAAANRDAASIEVLNASATKLSQKLATLVSSLGSISAECEEAIRAIIDAINLLDSGNLDGVQQKGRPEVLSDFTSGTQALSGLTQRIIQAARVSAAQLGVYSKEAATNITNLINSARSSRVQQGGGSSSTSSSSVPTDGPAAEVIKCCKYMIANPNEHAKVVAVSKKAATSASKIILNTKEVAANIPASEKVRQQKVLKAAKNMANAASKVAKMSQQSATLKTPDAAKQLVEAAEELKKATEELDALSHTPAAPSSTASTSSNSNASSSDTIDVQVSNNLAVAAKTVGVSVSELIRASAAVSANQKNDTAATELATATKAVSEGLLGLIQACALLNPGVQECKKAEETLQAVITDIDAASISVSIGKTKLEAPKDKTYAQMLEKFAETSKAIGEDISQLTNASLNANVSDLQSAARKLNHDSAALLQAAKYTVALAPGQDQQKKLLDLSKNLAETTLTFVKECETINPGDRASVDSLNSKGNEASQAVGKLLATLQTGVSLVKDLDKAIQLLSAAYHTIDQPLTETPKKKYAQYRQDVANFASSDLTEILAKVASSNGETVGQLGIHANRLAEGVPKFVINARSAIMVTKEKAASGAIAQSTKDLVAHVCNILEQAKNVAKEPTSRAHQQTLKNATQPAYGEVAKLIAALKKGAVGEVMAEKAIEDIQKCITDLNTSAIFAQAGQLEPDKSTISQTITALQDKLVSSANQLNVDSQKIADSVKQSPEAFGESAKSLAKSVTDTAKAATVAASRMQDTNSQQDVLGAAKVLGIRSHQLILAAKDFEKAPTDNALKQSVAQAQDGIRNAVQNMISVAQSASQGAAAGERELDGAKKRILLLLTEQLGYDSATPEDVIKAAREVTTTIADLVFANSQEEIISAAQKASLAIEKLLNSSITAAKDAPDPSLGKALEDAARTTAKTMTKFLDVCKLNRQDPTSQAKREESSSEVTQSVNNLVTALRSLPDADHLSLDQGQDLDKKAHDELLAAAKAIEEAANILQRQRSKNPKQKADQSVVDDQDIADAIVGATVAIAQAAGKLVNAATAAQQEKVDKNKKAKAKSDPTYANGLISAAGNLTGSVRSLCRTATDAAQGKLDNEALSQRARGVAQATAQLVSASRHNTDPNSKTQNTLGEAAKAVSTATSNLIHAAQQAAQRKEESVEVDDSAITGAAKEKLEQQIRILKLEAQIAAEKRRLARIQGQASTEQK